MKLQVLSRTKLLSSLALVLAATLSCKTGLAAWPKAQTDDQRAARLVEQALEAEVGGDSNERNRLLKEAIRISPDYAPARWQLGQVQYATKWRSLYEIERIAGSNTRLVEYKQLRKRVKPDAQSHIALANWCQKYSLNYEERVHLFMALQYKPGDKRLIRRLGLVSYKGKLIPKDELARQKEQEKQDQYKSKLWQQRASELRRTLAEGNDSQRAEALRQLRSITDPAAISALEAVFLKLTPAASFEERELRGDVIRVIGKMPQHEATLALVRQALRSGSPNLRAAATEQLKNRSPHDFVPMLVSSMTSPMKSNIDLLNTPSGVLFTHTYYREGANVDKRVIHQREYKSTAGSDDAESLALARQSALLEAVRVQRAVERENQKVQQSNQPRQYVLAETTGKDHGIEPGTWWRWWKEYNELYTSAKNPVYTDYFKTRKTYQIPRFSLRRSSTSTTQTTSTAPEPTGGFVDCFPAGTMVSTLTGPMAIEEIQPGQRVLAQDPDSGQLAYKSVLATNVRPPNGLVKIGLGKTSITASLGHPFWVLGKGWRMAKLLEVGDRLYCVNGSLLVDRVTPDTRRTTYNLSVEDFHTYFVGASRILVHDNNFRLPTTALVPGLARKAIW